MKRRYKKLTLVDREMLWLLRLRRKNYREIGKVLGVSHTTVSREVKRNSFLGMVETYLPAYAEGELRRRRKRRGRKSRLLDERIQNRIEEKLKEGWSPEQIAKTMPKGLEISHESIYKYVYAHKELTRYLPSKKVLRKKRRKEKIKLPGRFSIPNRVGLDQRPPEVNLREVFGHWEADLIVSSKCLAALNVLVERKSRKVHLTKINSKNSFFTRDAIVNRLSVLPPQARLSLTYDNGPEFALHEEINQKLGTHSYFCQPYRSWEKGTVENINGLIRRFIPKKTNIALLTNEEIQTIEYKLNNRPKKCLDYQTPQQVFINNL